VYNKMRVTKRILLEEQRVRMNAKAQGKGDGNGKDGVMNAESQEGFWQPERSRGREVEMESMDWPLRSTSTTTTRPSTARTEGRGETYELNDIGRPRMRTQEYI